MSSRATSLRRLASSLERLALHAEPDPKVEKSLDIIEDALGKLAEDVADTYLWRKFQQLRREYKVSLIPQIQEYLAKRGVNPNDNGSPIFRELEKIKHFLDANPTQQRVMAPDKDRQKAAKDVVEFLTRLSNTAGPLRPLVEKLNYLDLRKEAQVIQTFLKDSQGIADTVSRVVLNS